MKRELTKKIAELAKIQLSEEALDRFTEKVTHIIHYVEKLNALDCSHVEPTAHAMDTNAFIRRDEVVAFQDTEHIIHEAPLHESNLFKVPKVI